MELTELLLIFVLVAVLIAVVLQIIALRRKPDDSAIANVRDRLEQSLREEQRDGRSELREVLDGITRQQLQRIEQFAQHLGEFGTRTDTRINELRETLSADSRTARSESSELQQRGSDALNQRVNELAERTDKRLDEFRLSIAEDARKTRSESAEQQRLFAEQLSGRLNELIQRNEQRIGEMRHTLESQLKELQADNTRKLEQMRATVDEKLQSTLETRLGESFRLVSERLEAVQRGLGEMQQLAAGVGDLKRVLTNVKTRGTFGEVQLGALLEQMLVAEQYASQVVTIPSSQERVDYAVRMPGHGDVAQTWLPIDAKFPQDDYQRLLDAQDAADADLVHTLGMTLERTVRTEAKKIQQKYISPPHTTDFALMYLPTEGLYAEVIRRPGLFELLQREFKITLVGPTTLLALLNSLQMGFRTLAIEKRSSEVWQTLGAVKTEFGKFAGVLEKARNQLDTVRRTIDETGTRSRQIERKLKGVESLPMEQTQQMLGMDDAEDEQ